MSLRTFGQDFLRGLSGLFVFALVCAAGLAALRYLVYPGLLRGGNSIVAQTEALGVGAAFVLLAAFIFCAVERKAGQGSEKGIKRVLFNAGVNFVKVIAYTLFAAADALILKYALSGNGLFWLPLFILTDTWYSCAVAASCAGYVCGGIMCRSYRESMRLIRRRGWLRVFPVRALFGLFKVCLFIVIAGAFAAVIEPPPVFAAYAALAFERLAGFSDGAGLAREAFAVLLGLGAMFVLRCAFAPFNSDLRGAIAARGALAPAFAWIFDISILFSFVYLAMFAVMGGIAPLRVIALGGAFAGGLLFLLYIAAFRLVSKRRTFGRVLYDFVNF